MREIEKEEKRREEKREKRVRVRVVVAPGEPKEREKPGALEKGKWLFIQDEGEERVVGRAMA